MRKLRSDPVVFYSFLIGLIAIFVFGLIIFLFFSRLAPQVPLLYSIPWGENQLVPWQIIAILPLISLCLVTVNTILSLVMLRFEPLLARIVIIGAVLTIILTMTTGIKIILLTHL